MSRQRDHWLSAGVIGTFGDAVQGVGRQARIAVRRKSTGRVEIVRANSVAFERGLYALKNPPNDLNRRTVDTVLGTLEPLLPQVIAAIEQGNDSVEATEFVLDYVATLGARHPVYFQQIADAHQADAGLDILSGDTLQIARLHVLQNGLEQVRAWHWRTVVSPPDAPRFILSDLGFAFVGQQDRPGRALFIPLSPRMALLGFIGKSHGFASRFTATPLTVKWLNALTWSEAPREAYSHPDDAEMLATLSDPTEMHANPLGPFRGTTRNLLDEYEGPAAP